MIALAGIGRDFHLAKQRIHLLGFKPAPGAHRAVTGHGGGDVHETALERQRLVPFADMLGEVADQTRAIDFAEQRRRLAQRHRAGAEGFEDETIARKFLRVSEEVHHILFVQFDDIGDEQNLSSDAGPVDRRFEFFIDDTFVGGMLIDDDQTVARLRHDIGFVNLRARGA